MQLCVSTDGTIFPTKKNQTFFLPWIYELKIDISKRKSKNDEEDERGAKRSKTHEENENTISQKGWERWTNENEKLKMHEHQDKHIHKHTPLLSKNNR